ncbi:PHD finger protein EHD3-like isoform X2 [Humulus lupulus]|uniref:PHD finger protein EHD3-like isoform X2 n=1 Tax=Humulus lupulus TaxID=3486 RepID=UPI002B406A09|nr:PHD finger protein EHD3-like isoform X2 [Humulus lupulus]
MKPTFTKKRNRGREKKTKRKGTKSQTLQFRQFSKFEGSRVEVSSPISSLVEQGPFFRAQDFDQSYSPRYIGNSGLKPLFVAAKVGGIRGFFFLVFFFEMGGEEGTSNGDGTECSEGIQCLESDLVNNGVRFGNGTADVAGWSSGKSEGFRTYKRRKQVKSCSESKLQDDGRAYAKTASLLGQQPFKEQQGVFVENTCEHKQTCLCMDGLKNCSRRPWKIVLEHMYQSLSESEGGMHGCIQDALEFFPDINHVARAKCDHHIENRERCSSQPHSLLKGFQKEASGQVGVVSNGHLDSLNHRSVTEMCHHTCFDILTSEKFTSLCKLLLENFQEMKIDRFFDVTLINSRMKAGAYNHSPMLFHSDIQQGWGKLQAVGAEMVSLAKNLSDFSSSCYSKQVGGLVRSASEDGKQEFCRWESDAHTKVDRGEDCCEYRTCPCKRCGYKADGRDCLVCDSCEEMYHISCIEPAVEEIPPKSWYCAACTACGIRSHRENCVVCERMNKTVVKGVGNGSSCTNEEALELGDDSNCGTGEEKASKKSERIERCKICDSEIREGEKVKICDHQFCPFKLYHARCLTKKQLKSYGTTGWYCPSCLCRSCLTNKDDDDIIICDGCDCAYHIYCLKPELTSFPEGQWFCRSCEDKLHAIRTAKRAYENSENKQKKKRSGRIVTFENHGKWKSKGIMGSDKGGGMEMLLTAVNTLNYEEDLAGI